MQGFCLLPESACGDSHGEDGLGWISNSGNGDGSFCANNVIVVFASVYTVRVYTNTR